MNLRRLSVDEFPLSCVRVLVALNDPADGNLLAFVSVNLVTDPLAAMVSSYVDDPDIALIPADPARERQVNTWLYSVTPGQLDVDAVARALRSVGQQLHHRFASRGQKGVFYAWYDEMAGQLRCSLTSATPAALPFGGRYHLTNDPADVLGLIDVDPHPGFIPWTELSDISWDESLDSDGEGLPAKSFPVWVTDVG